MLRQVKKLPQPGDFQHWPPRRHLVVETAAQLLGHAGDGWCPAEWCGRDRGEDAGRARSLLVGAGSRLNPRQLGTLPPAALWGDLVNHRQHGIDGAVTRRTVRQA